MAVDIETPYTLGSEPINPVSEKMCNENAIYGLTKREYFAGLAMQALITNAPVGNLHNSEQGTSLAIQWADDLIKTLNNQPQQF